ncbi:hypothetical protein [Asticcacaulis benevestitus]|uniref:Uncharacterized protein n=1 Tax=Asticcacaulis benevestitus DSM 16100 = ATCC BAA-896 TaxID=1121022 RepID=V4PJ74_9CAUL|nr:hypothetical protein [Asticcacaulis benevestitus]ESQ87259.1 hypothetical protein ABENE_17300 [Asticcacaulis benevestitus DSM 16100 = ATCC BAA-896]
MTLFNRIRHLALLPLILGLTQCDVVEAIHNPKPKDGPYAYDLILKTSPKAEAALKSSEAFYVDAYYYGHAKPAFISEADTLHRIYLGRERWDYAPTSRRIHMYASKIDTKKLSQTIEGETWVVVTVIGSGVPGKVVDCHAYIGPIREAHQRAPEMHCELETENYWEEVAASAAEASASL